MRFALTLLVVVLLAPLIANAADAPTTLLLPTELVAGLRQYLGTRPYDEVNQMVNGLINCIRVQVPDAHGVITDRGECPAVSTAVAAHQVKPEASKP